MSSVGAGDNGTLYPVGRAPASQGGRNFGWAPQWVPLPSLDSLE
jgi:hypothetical protein